jgi:holliday junction DNA helicase RuvA
MIGSLRGVVLEVGTRRDGAGEALVEVGGVGYRVAVPIGTAAKLDRGAPAFFHVHTHVREDAIVLFGFASADERECFDALIGARGIGPSVALALLSVHSPAALRRAVAARDLDALTLVPGIGQKTAARLLVELEARLEPAGGEPDLRVVGGAARNGHGPATDPGRDPRSEVRTALAALGYGADEVRTALGALPESGSVEELLRVALRELAGAR